MKEVHIKLMVFPTCEGDLELINKRRFFEEMKWPRKLKGETMLEVGSGSGVFPSRRQKRAP